MQKTALHFTKPEEDVSLSALESAAKDWLLDCEIRQLSKSTLASRRIFADKLLRFLRQQEYPICGTSELRAFFAYLTNGHEKAEDAGERTPEEETPSLHCHHLLPELLELIRNSLFCCSL